MPRPLYLIAHEINRDWNRPYFGARPYIAAMSDLDTLEDKFLHDSARSVVAYFLANANTWRGDTARRVKTELRTMLKEAGYV